MSEVLVNRADWAGAPDLPEGWLIVNAPRPLRCADDKEWTGPFRHGRFYAAGPDPDTVDDEAERERARSRVRSWEENDAWPVVFTTNAEIEQQVLAKLAGHGYHSAAEAGVTVPDIAREMGLPWHETTDGSATRPGRAGSGEAKRECRHHGEVDDDHFPCRAPGESAELFTMRRLGYIRDV